MLQWIRKHRKALAGISVGAGAFFAAISFITYKVMAAEETTASGNNLICFNIELFNGFTPVSYASSTDISLLDSGFSALS